MAWAPAKPTFFDVDSRGKIRVWTSMTGTGGDTLVAEGIKRVFDVHCATQPIIWSAPVSTSANGATITMTITGTTTAFSDVYVYGQ